MTTINGKALVKDGKPLDKVFSNGRQVYGRNLLTGSKANELNHVNNTTVLSGRLSWSPDALGLLQLSAGGTAYISAQIDIDNYSVGGRNRVGLELTVAANGAANWWGVWTNGTNNTDGININVEGMSYHGRLYKKIIIPANVTSLGNPNSSLFWQGGTGASAVGKISKPMFTIGNVPSDWTPAPEDVLTS